MPDRAPIEEQLRDAGITWTLEVVPIDRIHANSWNPNQQDDNTKRATRESVATFGWISPVVVREHEQLDGHYEIIDGEHRWREAQELGVGLVPCIVVECDKPTAMKLTVVLNQGGENDTVALGALLAELEGTMGDGFRTALAFDDATLKHLLDVGRQDWSQQFNGGGEPDGDGEAGDGEGEPWLPLHAKVPASFMGVWDQVRDRAGDAGELREHDDPEVAAGLLIEVLAAAYLAGAD